MFQIILETHSEMEGTNAPLPAIPATDAAAFDVAAFDGRRRFQEIHELLTSFLDYQCHIRSHAAMALPPTILHLSEDHCYNHGTDSHIMLT